MSLNSSQWYHRVTVSGPVNGYIGKRDGAWCLVPEEQQAYSFPDIAEAHAVKGVWGYQFPNHTLLTKSTTYEVVNTETCIWCGAEIDKQDLEPHEEQCSS